MNSEIISLIKKRLEKGKQEYGHQINVYDGRDWIEETLEETLDGLVYLTAELIKLETLGREKRLKCQSSTIKMKKEHMYTILKRW